MKRISQYKKLFSVEKEIDLKTLKKSYRNLVKEWHPDSFKKTILKRKKQNWKVVKSLMAIIF